MSQTSAALYSFGVTVFSIAVRPGRPVEMSRQFG